MLQAPINLSPSVSKVALGTSKRIFAFPFVDFFLYAYLTNTHKFCTYYRVIGSVLYEEIQEKITQYRPSLLIVCLPHLSYAGQIY